MEVRQGLHQVAQKSRIDNFSPFISEKLTLLFFRSVSRKSSMVAENIIVLNNRRKINEKVTLVINTP
jgi:hypothetical protein